MKVKTKKPAKRALFLSPHADDAEHRCGGTMARMARGGVVVYHHVFSICQSGVPEGLPKDIRKVGCTKAAKDLKPKRLVISDYP